MEKREEIRKILFTVLGSILLAFSTAVFIIPNNVLTGGVSGVSIILSPLVPSISKQHIASFLSVMMFIIGRIFLGKDFAVNTVLSTIVYSLSLVIIPWNRIIVNVEPLIACLYGGLLGGIGVGIVMRQGGSTGGMDVPPLMMNRYFGLDVSKGILIVDALTVIIGLIEYDAPSVLYGLISVYFTSLGVEKAISFGGTRAKEIRIISDSYEKINEDILTVLDRGTTIYEASGGYTKNDKKVLSCVVEDKQYQTVMDIINRYDEYAFVIVNDVQDVHGEGFSVPVRI
ncbi:MAG: YitT family protein [Erysipelotrichaceae bacterium]|nr:YitT family protein [Erysipelotrichaceae bacterium]